MSKPKKSIVEPDIKVVGDEKPHLVETLIYGGNPPVIKSVGTVHVPKTNTHVSFVMTSQGEKILKIEVGEPNMKLIVDDEAKINFVNLVLAPKDFE